MKVSVTQQGQDGLIQPGGIVQLRRIVCQGAKALDDRISGIGMFWRRFLF